MVIYRILNSQTGYAYIGQTTRDFKYRKRDHTYALKAGRHSNSFLQNAWNKCGSKVFTFEIIGFAKNVEELNALEIETIRKNEKSYNLTTGGEHFNHTPETKKLISESAKLPIVGMNIKTKEIRHYPSAADTAEDGFDQKCVRKCVVGYVTVRKDGSTFKSLSHKGWIWTSQEDFQSETFLLQAEGAKRSKVRAERAVTGMSTKDGTVLRFASAIEAGRNGFLPQVVYKCCTGKVRRHRGYVWSYSDEPQSLLEMKRTAYITNPPKTGPKSWQF